MTDTLNTPSGDDSNKNSTISFKIGDREYDQESAVTKITNQDAFIEEQKTELSEAQVVIAELKEQAAQSTKLDDVLERLNRIEKPNGSNEEEHTTRSTDEELLGKMEERQKLNAEQERTERATNEAERIRKETLVATQKILVEKFGNDNVDTEIEKVMDLDTAIQMAQDPKLSKILLKQLKIEVAPPQEGPLNATHRDDGTHNDDALPDLRKTAGRKRGETFRELVAHYSQPEEIAKLREKAEQ